MSKKTTSIPVNRFADEHNAGISIDRLVVKDLLKFQDARQAHRHDSHTIVVLEKGTVSIEIDFKKHQIKGPSVVYMHPNQVHIVLASKNVSLTNLAITNENLNAEYLKLLESITPTKPLALQKESFALISNAASLCIKLSKFKSGKLYHSLLKDSSNALVALVISQFIERSESAGKVSRFQSISKAFSQILEQNYTFDKKPSTYAEKLNISTAYLNECVKHTTGYPVSYHIQQRVILEAKRLLYHSDKSVKEIAAELGYDDYPYFSRLFTKVVTISPLNFRNKNRD